MGRGFYFLPAIVLCDSRSTGVIRIPRGAYVVPAEVVRIMGGAKVLDDFVEQTTGRRPPVHTALPAPREILGLLPGFDEGGDFGDDGGFFSSDSNTLADAGTNSDWGNIDTGAADGGLAMTSDSPAWGESVSGTGGARTAHGFPIYRNRCRRF